MVIIVKSLVGNNQANTFTPYERTQAAEFFQAGAGSPEPTAEPTPETPAEVQAPVATDRLYPTWSDYYDLLAARAVTPERIAKLRKAGKPITRAYTITENATLGMPRGYYLPVYSDDSLWLYLLRP
jgi:hypothetical protein